MSDVDVPRIGKVPDCDHPTCRLNGSRRIRDLRWPDAWLIVCSLHTEWRPWDRE